MKSSSHFSKVTVTGLMIALFVTAIASSNGGDAVQANIFDDFLSKGVNSWQDLLDAVGLGNEGAVPAENAGDQSSSVFSSDIGFPWMIEQHSAASSVDVSPIPFPTAVDETAVSSPAVPPQISCEPGFLCDAGTTAVCATGTAVEFDTAQTCIVGLNAGNCYRCKTDMPVGPELPPEKPIIEPIIPSQCVVARCGDGSCDATETGNRNDLQDGMTLCARDCGDTTPVVETNSSSSEPEVIPQAPVCGNGVCEMPWEEQIGNPLFCAQDCSPVPPPPPQDPDGRCRGQFNHCELNAPQNTSNWGREYCPPGMTRTTSNPLETCRREDMLASCYDCTGSATTSCPVGFEYCARTGPGGPSLVCPPGTKAVFPEPLTACGPTGNRGRCFNCVETDENHDRSCGGTFDKCEFSDATSDENGSRIYCPGAKQPVVAPQDNDDSFCVRGNMVGFCYKCP